MPPVQKLIAFAGLSKQASKGTGATSPAAFGHGIISGKVFNGELTQDYEDQTLNGGAYDRFSPAVNRIKYLPGASFKTRAWIRSLGLYLIGAIGATVDTGAGPYTHTITPAQTLNYLTFFSRLGSAEYEKLVDCVVNSLTISWEEQSPLELDVELMGITPTFGAGGAWTATADESVATYLSPIGGTLQLDVGSATVAAGQIKAFSVTISNNLDPVWLSSKIVPDDLMPAEQTVEGTITLVPNDMTDFRKAITGTGAGTAVQSTPVYGSFSELVQLDANNQLTLSSLRSAFMVEFPDGDPAGGKTEIECAFKVIRPTDASSPFTAVLKNQTPSY